MGLSKKQTGDEPEPTAVPEKKETSMSIGEAIKDTKEAIKDFTEEMEKLSVALAAGEVSQGAKVMKRARRASMTLTEELVDFRKKLL